MNDNIRLKKALSLFVIVGAFTGIAIGFSYQLLPNYFKDAYDATAMQRGLIEIPRELPGLIAVFAIAAISFMNDIRKSIVAQALCALGMFCLALLHPPLFVMSIFLFIFSLGQHMFLPLQDSVALQLAGDEQAGKVLGRVNSVRMATLMISGVITFVGFRYGWFDFKLPVMIFIISAVAFIGAGIVLIPVDKLTPCTAKTKSKDEKHSRMALRKEYTRFYLICAVFGGRKQIMIVFSPWVLIDLLGFKADTMSILQVIGAFIGIFFIPAVGFMCDRLGVKKVLMLESAIFFFVYVIYGFLSKWVNENTVILTGLGMIAVYVLFIIDRMSEQFYMTRAVYIREIAVASADITPALSVGMAIDHIMAIGGSAICGVIWEAFGPEYVFMIAGALSVVNFILAKGIKIKKA